MSKTKSTHTLSKLTLLVGIFLIGIFSLIILHQFSSTYMENLDNKTKNLQAKIYIGEFIVNDLYAIRSDFYELATTTTNKRGRNIIIKRLKKNIKKINNALHVIGNGGVLKRVFNLNIAGHNTTTKTITYIKDEKQDFSLEVIDLEPKLEELLLMVEKITGLLEKKEYFRKSKEYKKFVEETKDIRRFYKTTPAFFIRITENTRRLLFEGERDLDVLKQKIEKEKNDYSNLEFALILAIIFIVLVLAYFIAKQINRDSKKLLKLNNRLSANMDNLKLQESATRGVLDGQPNIVVVSNGEEMIDGNDALIQYFDEFKSFQEFENKHACICDFFEEMNDDDYIIDKDYNGYRWYEQILANPNKLYKVAMKNHSGLNYFSISAKRKLLNDGNFIIIIALNDISNEIYAQNELKRLNDSLEDIVNRKTKELKILNENLEKKVLKELEKNRQKDKKMIQQSRFAALGEMIGNIAHQWRQPLSAISSTSSSMLLQLELDLANKNEIKRSYESISSYVHFLTQTIEDFRTFFKEDKKESRFNILDILKSTMSITEASYKDAQIKIIKEFETDSLMGFGLPNELSQVFLNILNNAKDALEEKKSKQPQVTIKAYRTRTNNIIEFYDNAGGIDTKIINKIFDPYFTTKHQSQGTGIGLYMSKEIVEKHLKGNLSVENREVQINNNIIQGACFIISLPKF